MLIYKTDAGQFAMSHGSYDSNLGSEILILGRDIRSRSWPNIGDSYGTVFLIKIVSECFHHRKYLIFQQPNALSPVAVPAAYFCHQLNH